MPPSASDPPSEILLPIAAAIHETWRQRAAAEGWHMQPHLDQPFGSLAPNDQADNLAAARRIPRVLAVAGLGLSRTDPALPPAAVTARMDAVMERMAEAEHDGWLEQRRQSGWRWGAERDNARKLHPSMIPYDQLTETEKEKDRSNIRNYPEFVARAGFRITALA